MCILLYMLAIVIYKLIQFITKCLRISLVRKQEHQHHHQQQQQHLARNQNELASRSKLIKLSDYQIPAKRRRRREQQQQKKLYIYINDDGEIFPITIFSLHIIMQLYIHSLTITNTRIRMIRKPGSFLQLLCLLLYFNSNSNSSSKIYFQLISCLKIVNFSYCSLFLFRQ